MSSSTTLTISTKEHIKAPAKEFFESIGMNLSSGINAFLVHVGQHQRMNFDISSTVATDIDDTEILQSGEEVKKT